jgi:light-regulated signal transduction histidine kinase (bacteriophytochrome)
MPSETLEIGGCAKAEPQDLAQFFADITEGLHAMAQPLTILRSSVPALAAVDLSPAKQRRYLELSVRQVQRACSLFECLQDLVVASQTPADCEPIDLSAMVAAVAADQQDALRELGIELHVLLPSGLPLALGDAARTRHALIAGLTVAALVSASGDVIHIMAAARNQRVELTLQIDRSHGLHLESHERLNLRVAQTNMLSQHGDYECTEDPFRVRLGVPCLPAEP